MGLSTLSAGVALFNPENCQQEIEIYALCPILQDAIKRRAEHCNVSVPEAIERAIAAYCGNSITDLNLAEANELSLEQQFSLTSYANSAKNMPADMLLEYLLDSARKVLISENMVRLLLAKYEQAGAVCLSYQEESSHE